ncbi:MAG: hypothetical protein Q9195_005169 [Heterodermia aff. obscurata]
MILSNLKALRLSHPRFAYLHWILRYMFYNFRIDADSHHIELLAETELSPIASFVIGVDLVAPLHSWTCKLADFKAIVHEQALCDHRNTLFRNRASTEQISEDNHLIEFFEENDFRDGYEHYRNKALANQESLRNHKSSFTKATLADAFRKLKIIYSINFYSFERSNTALAKQLIGPRKCAVQLEDHYMEEQRRRIIAGPVGDAVFEVGIESLAEADVCVQSLEIYCAMTDYFGWENIPSWAKLDLSSLQSLDFDPWVISDYSMGEFTGLPAAEYAFAISASDAIANLMRKCKDSLETFKYGHNSPKTWPGALVIPLPNLKELSLVGGYLEPKNAQRWLAEMSSLEKINLEYIGIQADRPSRYWDWLHFFDAIRNHTREMELSFEYIIVNYLNYSISLWQYINYEKDLEDEPCDDSEEVESQSLGLDLDGRIELNDTMRQWFERYYSADDD